MIVAKKNALVLLLLIFCYFAVAESPTAIAVRLQKQMQSVIRKTTPAYVAIGGGAGVIISPDGYIITNDHVAQGLVNWEVYTGTGQVYRARVVGRDRVGDLCLLKIENGQSLPWIALANSDDLQIGQWVLAFGNPFLFSRDGSPSVSLGIISALHRYQSNYLDAIQTDAALNPGNSGGPLVNLQGELVGVNGRIAPRYRNRRNSGIGYAITANQIRNFLEVLKSGKTVFHGDIQGIEFSFLYEGPGVMVHKIVPVSHAEQVGLRANDVILSIDGVAIHNIRTFYGRLWIYPAYHTIQCKVVRDGKVIMLDIKLFPKE